MLDQPEFNGGFSLLECRLGGVLSRNPFPGLRGGGHDCLPFGWPALLQLTETADPTEQAIQLINRDRFFEFRTGSVEQRLLAPRLTIAGTAESAYALLSLSRAEPLIATT